MPKNKASAMAPAASLLEDLASVDAIMQAHTPDSMAVPNQPFNTMSCKINGLRLKTQINNQGHWSVRARYAKDVRYRTCVNLLHSFTFHKSLFCYGHLARFFAITLTRYGPRKVDSDNLQSSFKHVRDEVARFLSVDDGDESRVSWAYKQAIGPYSVLIEIAPRA